MRRLRPSAYVALLSFAPLTFVEVMALALEVEAQRDAANPASWEALVVKEAMYHGHALWSVNVGRYLADQPPSLATWRLCTVFSRADWEALASGALETPSATAPLRLTRKTR